MESGNPQDHRAHVTEPLSPPHPSSGKPAGAGRRIALPILALFVMLLAASTAVLFLLPAPEPEPPVPPQQAVPHRSAVHQEPETALPDVPEDPARNDAATAREHALSLRITADSQSAAAWGREAYQSILDDLARADLHFAQEGFSAAAEQYRHIATDVQNLLDSRDQRFREAFAAGRQALADRRPEKAREQFSFALVIDPTSSEARTGLEQSVQLTSLISLVQEALSLEEANLLERAVAELEKALDIDNSYEPARQVRARIQARIDDRSFQTGMNALLSAIDRQDYTSARKSLQALNDLGINRDQVEQAEQLLAEKEKQAFVNSSRKAAETYRQNEQWEQALDTYRKIVQSAPDALFAVAGREEADKRFKLDTSLAEALGKPHRLQDEAQLERARQLLSYARHIDPQGPKLQSQIAALDTLLKKAARPITLTLESDNQTDIAIYHVGRIGMFFSTQVSLKPGTYTVVGSRVGYRDVRKTLTIDADGSDYRLVITCEEPI